MSNIFQHNKFKITPDYIDSNGINLDDKFNNENIVKFLKKYYI